MELLHQESMGWTMIARPNHGAAANGLCAIRSSVVGVRQRTVRSTAAAEVVAEFDR
jgi:hypothetical protein